MIIAGGCYRERCLVPEYLRILGSGGRAAAAISAASPGSVLHAYAFTGWADDVRSSMHALGILPILTEIPENIGFSYLHPLAWPTVEPDALVQHPAIQVNGDVVLRFGFMEGDAIVQANCAIYDPQSSINLPAFRDNGSSARTLAVVLNEQQLCSATNTTELRTAASNLMERWSASVIVVKAGVRGALVFDRERGVTSVPPYRSALVFKIGSGDVFSALFAHYWGEQSLDPAAAADLASRGVSVFVEDRALPIPAEDILRHRRPAFSGNDPGRIYLAGPFFDIAQRWRVEEALERLQTLGVSVFSPLHEVGTGTAASEIAGADLAGLRDCTAVLALVDGGDPGTLFEVGFARALGIPVVALAETANSRDLTMLEGSGCEITHDFASALYLATWAARR